MLPAAEVTEERLASGALYPSVSSLRRISRAIAVAVARVAMTSGVAGLPEDADVERVVDEAAWWPAYVPYRPG